MTKKINNNPRTCLVTKQLKDKKDLIRIVKTKEDKYFVDSDNKGRGAYVSRVLTNPEIIKKQKLLNRSFRKNVPDNVYQELLDKITGGNNGER